MSAVKRGRRFRRQEQTHQSQLGANVQNPAYRAPVNPYPAIEILSQDHIHHIHQCSLKLLQETGMRVLFSGAREIYKIAGAEVDDESMMVKIDTDLLMQSIASVPESLDLIHRNPERNNSIGKGALIFSQVGGAPNVSDLDVGKRPGTMQDFENFLKLSQRYDIIHMVGGAPEPIDIESNIRHLLVSQAIATLTDKFPFIYARGQRSIDESFEIIRLAHGIDKAQFKQGIYCNTVVNTNSPLQLDIPMSQAIVEFAKAGQLCIITPFTLAGAMAPVTLNGALILQNAEALMGIALSQMVNPGAPVAYGGFTSNVDMRSGAPAFGTPEYTKAAFASGQLARFYGFPWRSSNVNASNAPDAQSAYESQMALWGAIMGGANIIKHGAGWLEGGLTASYEKFIIDIEMLQMFIEIFIPIDYSPEMLALDAINDVGPGGHFFGTQHTLDRYKDAFYEPVLSDWQNYGSWVESGALDSAQRAQRIYKQVLNTYQAPPMDAGIKDSINDYVLKSIREGASKDLYDS